MSPETAALVILLLFVAGVMVRLADQPQCVGCGGRLRHTADCPLRRDG